MAILYRRILHAFINSKVRFKGEFLKNSSFDKLLPLCPLSIVHSSSVYLKPEVQMTSDFFYERKVLTIVRFDNTKLFPILGVRGSSHGSGFNTLFFC